MRQSSERQPFELASVGTCESGSFEPLIAPSSISLGYSHADCEVEDSPSIPEAAFMHDGASVSSMSASVIGKACAKIPPHKVRHMNWEWIVNSDLVRKHL